MFLEGGGQLIRDSDGEVVGAIGITGDTNEVDDLCAIAGIRAAGFKTDHDFDEADMRRLNIKRGPPIEAPEKAKPQLKRVQQAARHAKAPPQDVLFATSGGSDCSAGVRLPDRRAGAARRSLPAARSTPSPA